QPNLIDLPGNPQSAAAARSAAVINDPNITTRGVGDLDADNDPDVATTTANRNINPNDNTIVDPTDIESDPRTASTRQRPAQAAAPQPDPPPITAAGRIGIFNKGACPLGPSTPLRIFDVTAILAQDILPVEPVTGTRTLVYNNRNTIVNRIDPMAPPET